jgi:biopolymer transport protein ExbB
VFEKNQALYNQAPPLLFLHNLLVSRSKILVQILDEQTAGIMSRRAGK